MERLYTCEEVAKRYDVEIITVWRWIRQKKLKAIKIGTTYRIKESALDEFEKQSEV